MVCRKCFYDNITSFFHQFIAKIPCAWVVINKTWPSLDQYNFWVVTCLLLLYYLTKYFDRDIAKVFNLTSFYNDGNSSNICNIIISTFYHNSVLAYAFILNPRPQPGAGTTKLWAEWLTIMYLMQMLSIEVASKDEIL